MATLRLHTPSDAGKTIISHCSDGFTSLKLPLGRRHLKLVGFHERFAEALWMVYAFALSSTHCTASLG